MLKTLLRWYVFFVLPGLVFATAVLAGSEERENSHSFKLLISSKLIISIGEKKQKLDADADLLYTWTRVPGERILIFDALGVAAFKDGKPIMKAFMSRAKLLNDQEEIPFEQAPEHLKNLLKDTFGVPICKIQIDAGGKETKRRVVAGPGAKDLVDQGMIANATFFHTPFLAGHDKWEVQNELSMGNGGYAKGTLTYEKAKADKGEQRFNVTGTLANDYYQAPGQPVAYKEARYVIRGEQIYDPTKKEWTSGKLNIDVSFQMTQMGATPASAKGTILVQMESVSRKK